MSSPEAAPDPGAPSTSSSSAPELRVVRADETAEDVAEYMVVGAAAVQVGTASFIDPKATERLVDGLEKWCFTNNISNMNELRGSLRQ